MSGASSGVTTISVMCLELDEFVYVADWWLGSVTVHLIIV